MGFVINTSTSHKGFARSL